MKIAQYFVVFTATGDGFLPPVKGNLLRSALGAQARAVLGQSSYARLFEGRGEGRLPGQERIPPFATFCADRRKRMVTGDEVLIRISLVNPSELEPLLFDVLPHVGRNFGRMNMSTRVTQQRVWTLDDFAAVGQSRASGLTIKFATPLRLETSGKPITEPTFRDLVIFLTRRAATLGRAWGDGVPWWAGEDLAARAEEIQCNANLTWCGWERESRSQNKRIDVGGVVGTLRLRGGLAPFMPLLTFGAVMHVGAGVTCGNGVIKF